ncbi:MAG: DUF4129 domain-containing protein [Lentisphaerae bacterium]|nr:DUF4129 domain-containing protein [Lentisphaerota bacterium]
MMNRQANRGELPAIELVSEAVHLVRTAQASSLATYYIGTIPFVVGLLFFWSDMSRSAFAPERCFTASLCLALLFIWMKCWQAAFAGGLLDRVSGRTAQPWTFRRVVQVAAIQLALQPYALIALPISLLITIPFFPLYGFYQVLSPLGDGRYATARETARVSWRSATYSPRQNAIVIWLLSPWILAAAMVLAFGLSRLVISFMPELHYMHGLIWFILALLLMLKTALVFSPLGCVVIGNVALLLIMIPSLLRAMLGIETSFTLSGWHAIFNTTFLFSVFSMAYLCLDPLAKAAYVLRCFYGESVRSGADLRVELKELVTRTGRTLAIMAVVMLTSGSTLAAPAPREAHSVSPAAAQELNHNIEQTLSHPRYSWRLPRERAAVAAEPSLFRSFLEHMGHALQKVVISVAEKLDALIEWLDKLFKKHPRPTTPKTDWQQTVQILLFALLATTASVMGIFLYRYLKRRGRITPTPASVLTRLPNLEDEGTTAEELPSEEWTVLAARLMAEGELRLGLRAIFFACLARLGEQGRVALARHKSNRDYCRELARRAESVPTTEAFKSNVRIIEATWYGDHAVTEDTATDFRANHEQIVGHA